MEDQNIVSANIRMADSCFFDVFPQKILIGKAKQILSQPLSCLIDSETAAKIGGNVVGKHFTLSNYPGTTLPSMVFSKRFHGVLPFMVRR